MEGRGTWTRRSVPRPSRPAGPSPGPRPRPVAGVADSALQPMGGSSEAAPGACPGARASLGLSQERTWTGQGSRSGQRLAGRLGGVGGARSERGRGRGESGGWTSRAPTESPASPGSSAGEPGERKARPGRGGRGLLREIHKPREKPQGSLRDRARPLAWPLACTPQLPEACAEPSLPAGGPRRAETEARMAASPGAHEGRPGVVSGWLERGTEAWVGGRQDGRTAGRLDGWGGG